MMLDEYNIKENNDDAEDAGERADTNADPEIEIIDPDNPESKNKNEKAKEVLDNAGDQL